MTEPHRQGLNIRNARPEDCETILEMIRELAEFEKLSHQVIATPEDFRKHLFGDQPAAEALLAEWEGNPVGYAIFFTTFSTFIGKPGLWLEDLYVKPALRGKGVGKALLLAGNQLAKDRGCGRYEWSVLDWNQNAISFYESMGADIMPDWRIVRLTREKIERLANS